MSPVFLGLLEVGFLKWSPWVYKRNVALLWLAGRYIVGSFVVHGGGGLPHSVEEGRTFFLVSARFLDF